MCGIIGTFGAYTNNSYAIVEWLLKIDTIRGEDSTGVLTVFNDDTLNITKSTGNAYDFLTYSDFEEDTSISKHMRKPAKLILGHNRSTTVGVTSEENAHPFKHDHITCVHNGTIYNHFDLTDAIFTVDSEAITYAISVNGIEKTWKDIQGAATLAWWDADKKSFNFIRNKERPLHFLFNKSKTRMIFASERFMLAAVRDKNFFSDWEDVIYQPNPHYLHSFTYVKNKLILVEKEIKEQIVYTNNWYDNYLDPIKSYWKHTPNKMIEDKSRVVTKVNKCRTCNIIFLDNSEIINISSDVNVCSECFDILFIMGCVQETYDNWSIL